MVAVKPIPQLPFWAIATLVATIAALTIHAGFGWKGMLVCLPIFLLYFVVVLAVMAFITFISSWVRGNAEVDLDALDWDQIEREFEEERRQKKFTQPIPLNIPGGRDPLKSRRIFNLEHFRTEKQTDWDE